MPYYTRPCLVLFCIENYLYENDIVHYFDTLVAVKSSFNLNQIYGSKYDLTDDQSYTGYFDYLI